MLISAWLRVVVDRIRRRIPSTGESIENIEGLIEIGARQRAASGLFPVSGRGDGQALRVEPDDDTSAADGAQRERGHGRRKVLFGSNYPMITPFACLEHLDDLDLDDEARELFLHGNAERVFGIG